MSVVKKYIRKRFFPHIWCPGCGHGTILNALIRSIDELELEKNDIVVVSGIGCSARISGYLDFHTLHTLHGRALAFATGVKMSRPDLKIIVPMGDGDAMAIGGNHLIHAARRNIDITVLIFNNRIYGMTGGQHSPLSGCGIRASTAPYSTIDHSFDTVELARGAGATFVARTTTYHVREMQQLITRAISHTGFSLVEILSQCPTHFGRRNGSTEAVEMLTTFKERTVPKDSPKRTDDPSLIPRGVFVETERPEYCEEYGRMVARVAVGVGEDES